MATQGVVKTYDPVTGVGVVVLDEDQSEVYLRPGSLNGSIFRMLRQGQRILFDLQTEDDRRYVTSIKVGQSGY
ncbi:MAG: cold shock domain-containing protein [Acidimicrobiia bacterium]|nr:cold shock domain-containing protein [Acidimicrobiia bacterium]